jgi:CubicO group peptidase (beta-lactamase class C family)
MKRLLALCMFLCFLPTMACALTPDELDQQAGSLFQKSHTVGGALAVLFGGKIVYERYYGYQDFANLIPVTADTYFRIASVTKMVSAIGLLQLKEQGLVDLDADIGYYFGYEIANAYYPDVPITLRQLMSHTSTLSISGGYGSENPIRDMLAKERRRHASFTDNIPGSVYEYSNFGAGVAGAILEAVTGVSVNRYMRENVFAPLSIDASYDAAALSDPAFVTTLYNSDGTRYHSAKFLLQEAYEDFANPENHYRTTVGSLWIRARDLATLTIALCGNGTVNGVELLSPESVSLMRDDQASYHRSVTGESPYGLFLQREDSLMEGHAVYGHQGLVAGVLCNVYFEPASSFGIVLLTNGCNNALQDHIGVLARRMFQFAYKNFVGNEDYQPYKVR